MITRAGEGETITARERRDVILLADHQEISITRSRYGPGERGPDPHVHREHTDSFYVLEGELRFEVGPGLEPVRVGPGGFVWLIAIDTVQRMRGRPRSHALITSAT